MRRQEIDGLDFFQGSLGIHVEQAQAVDFVVKKVETVGLYAAHGVQIKQRAAGRVLAVFHHLIHMAVTRLFQLAAQRITRQALAFFHHQRMTMQKTVRAYALHKRIDR